jgi:WD40 repeat protein
VIENTDNKPQKFIYCDPGTRGISCLAVSPSHRFLAFGEIAEPPIIVIYDLKTDKRVKTLQSPDVRSSSAFVSIDFSKTQENKHLIALAGAPDYQLMHFDWNKSRQLGAIPVKVAIEG